MRTLLIDAATATLFVGAYEGGAWLKLLRQKGGTLEGLFELAKELFAEYPLENFQRIVLCEGPGRLMALRIAAVAANEWGGQGKEKFTYNSLQLAACAAKAEVGYELRAGSFAIWREGKIEIVPNLPEGTLIIGSAVNQGNEKEEMYAQAVEEFPKLEQTLCGMSRPVTDFDPPVWSGFNYALAKNRAVSRENL